MADVSVDIETGIVKMNNFVAVQDCGLIIDMKTAESQVFGAMIMGVCYSLYEEKIMDDQTGRMLNPNMEFYKLAGLADIGNFKVHMMTGKGYDERGPIGLGEPPTVSPGAAICQRGGQCHRRPTLEPFRLPRIVYWPRWPGKEARPHEQV
jgi:xanthine dehydrogenase YagR molybdenum-binding subunit